MFKTGFKNLRQPSWLMIAACLALLTLTIVWPTIWLANAATDPAANSASPKPDTNNLNPSATATTPAYGTSAVITGPTTPFHDSVAARYIYAFGKDTPFLPSFAASSNGQFMSPKNFPTAQYCGHSIRRPTTSGASRFIPTASAHPGT